MVKEILPQMRRQQALYEGGLTTTLCSYERGHTLVAMQRVHLQPVGHCRAQPDGEEGMLFGGDARQSGEELCHMVLSVPFGQTVEVLLNRVMVAYLFRVN